MAAAVKFQSFSEAVAEKKHNLGSDTLKVALTNTAPNAATNTVLADITQIANGNGYTTGGATVTVTASAQSGGTYTLTCNQVSWTASGGSIGPFRYAVLYNDTATNDELIEYWDIGSQTLTTGQVGTLQFNSANPGAALTIA
jgi:hypothetical protein